MHPKFARPDHPILPCLAERWSPYGFQEKAVPESDLKSLFEAARWAPSSYNEQPWAYILATRDNPAEFHRLLGCLVEANQKWACHVGALALGCVRLTFSKNGKENRAAVHDLGLAAGNLLAEATARGLHVHQMIGIQPEVARQTYAIPPEYTAWTAIAIGYAADPATLPQDTAPRPRKPLSQFVFGGTWGSPYSKWLIADR